MANSELCICLKCFCESNTVKPVMLATLVSQWPVIFGHSLAELANSYDMIHIHYSITWIMAEVSRLMVCLTCKFNLRMLADLKICVCSFCVILYMGWNLIHCQNCLLPIQPPSILHMYGQQIGISWWTWPITVQYLKSLLIDRVYSTAPVLYLNCLFLHSELYICPEFQLL